MALVLTLQRDALSNDDDAAGTGRWQYEGGRVAEGDREVGWYAVERRVTFGATDAQNTAVLTMSVFFTPDKPPQNIIMQGSHDFNSGGEIGSVSAASSTQAAHIGKSFKRLGDTVTIG